MADKRKRTILIGVLVLLIVVALAAYFFTRNNTPYVPLFSYDLNKEQMQEVEDFLKKGHYDFQTDKKAILVHENEKQEILLEASKSGIPSK
ncbi:hypothetical protein [Brevibacillus massiliensis]|jgi:flagellar biosynthesis/type III secretory pathway M-ring protein FliF/YscJ|uniref:hypothetical protein n=1 Tax=Brevibacillus massiliensis TaxID=1118054 RepID=UPI000307A4A1|nr:hypothetical protein [Brevibacillus massiliensis]